MNLIKKISHIQFYYCINLILLSKNEVHLYILLNIAFLSVYEKKLCTSDNDEFYWR